MKGGPLKLSLLGSACCGDGDKCGCGFGNGSSYDSLPRSLIRSDPNAADAKSYGSLPKNCFSETDNESSQFGTLMKSISGRNVTAGIPGRETSAPSNLPPRNGLVVYRMCGDGNQRSPVHRMQQKMNSECKVRRRRPNRDGVINYIVSRSINFFF